ncbi:MAG: hypothetical protein JST29_01230 [Bacteroidetes bacterium]|nr:hypothetical protein [Bacteroidota bacterium]MBS1591278.1 hypothetical protein [Bacteroidota bacterium]
MRKLIFLIVFTIASNFSKAQMYDAYEHAGEFGISVGAAHYFGDLNNTAALNRPKFAAGIFYNRQLNNYISIRINGSYSMLGYSDAYSENPVQRIRNLSFNTNVWEISASGIFNFFRFVPGFPEFSFTPYVGLGIGAFNFDPYTYLNGEKIYLRPLGTEGQGSSLYPNLKPYSSVAMCIPLTIGFKKALNERMNIFAEVSYRFTNTNYLDDIGGVYAPDAFSPVDANGNPSTWFLLQDRSYETTNTPIGVKGRQRGVGGSHKDSYATFQIGVSFNLQSYRCPKN